uniref:Uncharacterized protein n=1 Tax=Chromera velia CCMP2878 TaxID=1169474 RepID=A0A0G4HU58_9ALVE|eukprot:Cvel_8600.t1-p1 / transcript=Cvel_8600.t1 / gene=Cvel_8600 / organism=Chromera_velia_CCMP2878 / gene_product=Retinitis pigmentosa 1-like 1 protein, putative / transcript_product=Retinitis pigmentosa 1-like 1 protein, putative / location=Cvel_scaffold477:64604-74556(-) / protein_length=3042 / sequence_SO=supercontig / SO=protein_coding / is_pseudo=false
MLTLPLRKNAPVECVPAHRFGHTPLHTACLRNQLGDVKAILAGSREPPARLLSTLNALDDSGCTPLHFAASRNHHEVIEFLLQHPLYRLVLRTDAQDTHLQRTPLMEASEKGFTRSVDLLLGHELFLYESAELIKDISWLKEPEHFTVMPTVSAWEHKKNPCPDVQTDPYLIAQPPKLSVAEKDFRGKTALDLAAERKHAGVIKCFHYFHKRRNEQIMRKLRQAIGWLLHSGRLQFEAIRVEMGGARSLMGSLPDIAPSVPVFNPPSSLPRSPTSSPHRSARALSPYQGPYSNGWERVGEEDGQSLQRKEGRVLQSVGPRGVHLYSREGEFASRHKRADGRISFLESDIEAFIQRRIRTVRSAKSAVESQLREKEREERAILRALASPRRRPVSPFENQGAHPHSALPSAAEEKASRMRMLSSLFGTAPVDLTFTRREWLQSTPFEGPPPLTLPEDAPLEALLTSFYQPIGQEDPAGEPPLSPADLPTHPARPLSSPLHMQRSPLTGLPSTVIVTSQEGVAVCRKKLKRPQTADSQVQAPPLLEDVRGDDFNEFVRNAEAFEKDNTNQKARPFDLSTLCFPGLCASTAAAGAEDRLQTRLGVLTNGGCKGAAALEGVRKWDGGVGHSAPPAVRELAVPLSVFECTDSTLQYVLSVVAPPIARLSASPSNPLTLPCTVDEMKESAQLHVALEFSPPSPSPSRRQGGGQRREADSASAARGVAFEDAAGWRDERDGLLVGEGEDRNPFAVSSDHGGDVSAGGQLEKKGSGESQPAPPRPLPTPTGHPFPSGVSTEPEKEAPPDGVGSPDHHDGVRPVKHKQLSPSNLSAGVEGVARAEGVSDDMWARFETVLPRIDPPSADARQDGEGLNVLDLTPVPVGGQAGGDQTRKAREKEGKGGEKRPTDEEEHASSILGMSPELANSLFGDSLKKGEEGEREGRQSAVAEGEGGGDTLSPPPKTATLEPETVAVRTSGVLVETPPSSEEGGAHPRPPAEQSAEREEDSFRGHLQVVEILTESSDAAGEVEAPLGSGGSPVNLYGDVTPSSDSEWWLAEGERERESEDLGGEAGTLALKREAAEGRLESPTPEKGTGNERVPPGGEEAAGASRVVAADEIDAEVCARMAAEASATLKAETGEFSAEWGAEGEGSRKNRGGEVGEIEVSEQVQQGKGVESENAKNAEQPEKEKKEVQAEGQKSAEGEISDASIQAGDMVKDEKEKERQKMRTTSAVLVQAAVSAALEKIGNAAGSDISASVASLSVSNKPARQTQPGNLYEKGDGEGEGQIGAGATISEADVSVPPLPADTPGALPVPQELAPPPVPDAKVDLGDQLTALLLGQGPDENEIPSAKGAPTPSFPDSLAPSPTTLPGASTVHSRRAPFGFPHHKEGPEYGGTPSPSAPSRPPLDRTGGTQRQSGQMGMRGTGEVDGIDPFGPLLVEAARSLEGGTGSFSAFSSPNEARLSPLQVENRTAPLAQSGGGPLPTFRGGDDRGGISMTVDDGRGGTEWWEDDGDDQRGKAAEAEDTETETIPPKLGEIAMPAPVPLEGVVGGHQVQQPPPLPGDPAGIRDFRDRPAADGDELSPLPLSQPASSWGGLTGISSPFLGPSQVDSRGLPPGVSQQLGIGGTTPPTTRQATSLAPPLLSHHPSKSGGAVGQRVEQGPFLLTPTQSNISKLGSEMSFSHPGFLTDEDSPPDQHATGGRIPPPRQHPFPSASVSFRGEQSGPHPHPFTLVQQAPSTQQAEGAYPRGGSTNPFVVSGAEVEERRPSQMHGETIGGERKEREPVAGVEKERMSGKGGVKEKERHISPHAEIPIVSGNWDDSDTEPSGPSPSGLTGRSNMRQTTRTPLNRTAFDSLLDTAHKQLLKIGLHTFKTQQQPLATAPAPDSLGEITPPGHAAHTPPFRHTLTAGHPHLQHPSQQQQFIYVQQPQLHHQQQQLQLQTPLQSTQQFQSAPAGPGLSALSQAAERPAGGGPVSDPAAVSFFMGDDFGVSVSDSPVSPHSGHKLSVANGESQHVHFAVGAEGGEEAAAGKERPRRRKKKVEGDWEETGKDGHGDHTGTAGGSRGKSPKEGGVKEKEEGEERKGKKGKGRERRKDKEKEEQYEEGRRTEKGKPSIHIDLEKLRVASSGDRLRRTKKKKMPVVDERDEGGDGKKGKGHTGDGRDADEVEVPASPLSAPHRSSAGKKTAGKHGGKQKSRKEVEEENEGGEQLDEGDVPQGEVPKDQRRRSAGDVDASAAAPSPTSLLALARALGDLSPENAATAAGGEETEEKGLPGLGPSPTSGALPRPPSDGQPEEDRPKDANLLDDILGGETQPTAPIAEESRRPSVAIPVPPPETGTPDATPPAPPVVTPPAVGAPPAEETEKTREKEKERGKKSSSKGKRGKRDTGGSPPAAIDFFELEGAPTPQASSPAVQTRPQETQSPPEAPRKESTDIPATKPQQTVRPTAGQTDQSSPMGGRPVLVPISNPVSPSAQKNESAPAAVPPEINDGPTPPPPSSRHHGKEKKKHRRRKSQTEDPPEFAHFSSFIFPDEPSSPPAPAPGVSSTPAPKAPPPSSTAADTLPASAATGSINLPVQAGGPFSSLTGGPSSNWASFPSSSVPPPSLQQQKEKEKAKEKKVEDPFGPLVSLAREKDKQGGGAGGRSTPSSQQKKQKPVVASSRPESLSQSYSSAVPSKQPSPSPAPTQGGDASFSFASTLSFNNLFPKAKSKAKPKDKQSTSPSPTPAPTAPAQSQTQTRAAKKDDHSAAPGPSTPSPAPPVQQPPPVLPTSPPSSEPAPGAPPVPVPAPAAPRPEEKEKKRVADTRRNSVEAEKETVSGGRRKSAVEPPSVLPPKTADKVTPPPEHPPPRTEPPPVSDPAETLSPPSGGLAQTILERFKKKQEANQRRTETIYREEETRQHDDQAEREDMREREREREATREADRRRIRERFAPPPLVPATSGSPIGGAGLDSLLGPAGGGGVDADTALPPPLPSDTLRGPVPAPPLAPPPPPLAPPALDALLGGGGGPPDGRRGSGGPGLPPPLAPLGGGGLDSLLGSQGPPL